jgi:hypothetical protein
VEGRDVGRGPRPRGGEAEEGSRFGDLSCFLRPGYSDWDGSIASIKFDLISESGAREVTKPLQYVSGNHTVYLPTERYGNFTNGALTIFGGRIRRNSAARHC